MGFSREAVTKVLAGGASTTLGKALDALVSSEGSFEAASEASLFHADPADAPRKKQKPATARTPPKQPPPKKKKAAPPQRDLRGALRVMGTLCRMVCVVSAHTRRMHTLH